MIGGIPASQAKTSDSGSRATSGSLAVHLQMNECAMLKGGKERKGDDIHNSVIRLTFHMYRETMPSSNEKNSFLKTLAICKDF